jgi:hypothetical protein
MKKLTEFQFNEFAEKYDWETLLDGGIYELIKGVDFTCKPATFRHLFLAHAREAGLIGRSSVKGEKVVVRAIRKVPERNGTVRGSALVGSRRIDR